MPDIFALDSNVYIDALRSRPHLDALQQFLMRAGGRVVVSTVVAMELRAGAHTADDEADVRALIGAYRQRERIIAPTFEAFVEAGRVLAALRAPARPKQGAFGASMVSDALIATSCRESQAVLITRNAGDFAIIQRHLRGFRFVSPWPLIGRGR